MNTDIALQVQTPNIMLPSEAIGRAADARMAQLQVADKQRSAEQRDRLNALYRQSGGDLNKMLQSGDLDMDTAMSIMGAQGEQRKLSAQADKEAAAADKYRIQAGIEKLGYGAQLLQGATPENWQEIRAEFGNMTGQDLGEQYDAAKVRSLMQRGLTMKERLANEWKQKGYELDVAQFGEQQRHNMTQEGISAMNANQRASGGGKPIFDSSRGILIDPATGESRPVMAGGAPVGAKPASGKGSGGLSATAQKELFEADDMVLAGENVKSAIDDALALNNKAYSGLGASERATIRSNLPGDSESADATVQMNNIILGQALESLKATFGAAPTEGERAILVQLQASVDKTPKQREDILKKAKELADKRINFNRNKANQLRSGEYMQEGGAPYSQEAEADEDSDLQGLW